MNCLEIPVQLDGSGAADFQSAVPLNGDIAEIRVIGAGLTNAGKPDITITRKNDGAQVLKQVNTDAPYSRVPQQPVQTNEGAAALYAAGGVAVLEEIPIDGYLRIQVAEGNANGKGTIFVYVDGE